MNSLFVCFLFSNGLSPFSFSNPSSHQQETNLQLKILMASLKFFLAEIFIYLTVCVIFHMSCKLFFYDSIRNFCSFNSSYYASTLFPAVNPQPRAVKRQRLMTSPQARSAGIITSPQNQVVIQSPQQQQQIAANKLTSAANSLLQLQQQQQQMILASATPVVNLCNSMVSQNFVNNNSFKMCNGDNNETVNQQTSATGPFKVYSKLNILC